jgi:hypothetical protein
MTDDAPGFLLRQFDLAWALARHHFDGLTTEECLWHPGPRGLHVHRDAAGQWTADWPDHEGYDLGPPSIGWLTWHFGLWWSMALDHSFGAGTLAREQVAWPGTGERAREWIAALATQWRSELEPLTLSDLRSSARTRWPFQDRPFGDLVAWANVELTKNAAEIGHARFLHAVAAKREAGSE